MKTDSVPTGYCQCGCGKRTLIATRNDRPKGYIKGIYQKFAKGHKPTRPIAERFWEKVDIRGADECWLWKYGRKHFGYGQFNIGHDNLSASRVAYILTYGDIPSDNWVLHTCDTPACNNPKHLYLGTPTDNVHDMINRGRAKMGHHEGLRGETNPLSKIRNTDIPKIRQMARQGISHRKIGQAFGVSKTTIGYILNGRTWTHIV